MTDLVIYDARGRVVRQLLEGVYPAGRSAVNWDGRNDAGRRVASGVYLYRFRAGDYESTHRMVLVK